MRHAIKIALMLAFCAGIQPLSAQDYQPVAITGFNNDVVAETGTSSLAVTTTELDLSFYLLFSQAFANANGLSGGLPDNGTIVNGNRSYQLAPYDVSNGLYLSENGDIVNTAASGAVILTTPASFSRVSLLLFSTEGNSTLTTTLHFTDGTSAPGGTVTVNDWFNGPDEVLGGYGRITRKDAGPYTVDGLFANNPRFYKYDIALGCSNRTKLLDSISIDYISSSGSNFPSRAVIMALSGIPNTPVTVTADITPATCNDANGSIALSISGGTGLSYAWTSSPVQVNDTATNLPAGDYTCTILDGNGCATIYKGTVPKKTAATITAAANADSLCKGAEATLSATATGSPVTDYTWQPGNGSGTSFKVSPTATTTYTVSATDTLGCKLTATVKLTVTEIPAAPDATAVTACVDSTALLTISNPLAAYTYRWYSTANGTTVAGTGKTYGVPAANTNTTWYVEAVNGRCASERVPVAVNRLQQEAAPVVTAINITPNSVVFTWPASPEATGYEVSVNGSPYGMPSSGPAGTTHEVTGISLADGVTIQVIALGDAACQNSDPGNTTAKLLSQDVFIPNAFTPNQDGKNDLFKPEGNIISGVEMKIFNQWGELLYASTERSAAWDGTVNGKPQPMGVYVYAIRLKLADGKETLRKGSVNLIRP
ncbi:T9SS type B sorting domain-containing protein [Chitinophaga agrisoli]|uniref:T9SS type B sorting domain-containing protein n=1 Tax=Chitinophaga agrisoli TaxID=2607653 RepID=A0A5B2VVH2_9BACT|nr:gliding motility-associated C-terminal domain-containing protein [Chitinophaga agrisoli]KAA2242558.1 T9SS type B sorting domain-containing protein [Chitinophaga agrisoli]